MDEVKGADRAAARAKVEAAFRAGRIIEVDKDLRVGQIETASSRTELASITRGLDPVADAAEEAAARGEQAGRAAQWPPTPPDQPAHWAPAPTAAPPHPVALPPTTHQPHPSPEPGDPSTWQVPVPDQPAPGGPQVVVGGTSIDLQRAGASVARTARRVVMTFVLLFVLAAVGVTVLVARGFDDLGMDDLGLDDLEVGSDPVDIQTPAGVAEVIDAIEAETGSTMALEATFFEDYAIVSTPVEPGSKRHIAYRYDGDLEEFTRGTSTYEPFDLREIDGRVLRRLLKRAERTLVDDATSGFAIVHSPPPLGQDGWIWAYARNEEFGENGFLVATMEGKVIDTHPAE